MRENVQETQNFYRLFLSTIPANIELKISETTFFYKMIHCTFPNINGTFKTEKDFAPETLCLVQGFQGL